MRSPILSSPVSTDGPQPGSAGDGNALGKTDPRFKVGHGAILNRVVHLDRMAANLAVLNEGLAPYLLMCESPRICCSPSAR
jgi:hypothetical protein